ncbi:MAG TPA: CoA-transferase [Solirubrobacteraceae bacterium]
MTGAPETPSGRRRSKLLGLEEAGGLVRDGDHVAVGGIWSENCPAALVRAVIRGGATGLTLSAGPAAGFAAELLIAAGRVRQAYLPNVTFEHLGMAPAFRDAVQQGRIELVECDEPSLVGGYRAAAAGLPTMPIRSLGGTALARARPDLLAREDHGETVLDAPALAPDVVLLHAAAGDVHGNLRQPGAQFADKLMAKAARRTVIASLDTVLDNAVIREDPSATSIPGYLITHVCELPLGAHPGACHSVHRADEEHLRAYIAAATDPAALAGYMARFVTAGGHDAYLERCGGRAALIARLGDRG